MNDKETKRRATTEANATRKGITIPKSPFVVIGFKS